MQFIVSLQREDNNGRPGTRTDHGKRIPRFKEIRLRVSSKFVTTSNKVIYRQVISLPIQRMLIFLWQKQVVDKLHHSYKDQISTIKIYRDRQGWPKISILNASCLLSPTRQMARQDKNQSKSYIRPISALKLDLRRLASFDIRLKNRLEMEAIRGKSIYTRVP